MKYLILTLFIILIMASQSHTFSYYSPGKTDNNVNKQIPVLCYHNIKENPTKENLFIISEIHFEAQLKLLRDSAYHSISPDQLFEYLTMGIALPSKPIIISFDDTHAEHYSIAKPILEKYGFKGVFFIMTVCIGKPNYMTAAQIKELSEAGHTIGAHTWNHPNMTSLTGDDWEKQIVKPILQLEKITGKPVDCFAYPNGVWNENTIAELKKYGIKIGFQLIAEPSKREPQLTVRRLMVSGKQSPTEMKKQITRVFR